MRQNQIIMGLFLLETNKTANKAVNNAGFSNLLRPSKAALRLLFRAGLL